LSDLGKEDRLVEKGKGQFAYMNPCEVLTDVREGLICQVVIAKNAGENSAECKPHLTVESKRRWSSFDRFCIFKDDES